MEKRKTAIILQGGALRAAFGAGALYALLKSGFRADHIAGSSASALTAAYAAAGQIEEMKKIWTTEVGTKRFVRLGNAVRGRPVFDVKYLIEEILQERYPLDVEALALSGTTWNIPLFDYRRGESVFRSNKDADFRRNVWNFLRISCIVHSEDVLRGIQFEQYVDGGLDPYALFRTEWVPEGSRVFVIWSEGDRGWHFMKRLGSLLFKLFQSRHFPPEIREALGKRRDVLDSGERAYQDFKERHEVIEIVPPSGAWYESLRVIDPSQRRIAALFEEGERAAFDSPAKSTTFCGGYEAQPQHQG